MVIETLAKRLPDIVIAIAENAPRIAIALAKALGDPRTAWYIAVGIVQGLAEVFTAELGRWGEALEPLWNAIYEFFTGFFEAVGDLGFTKLGEDINAFFDGFAMKIGDLATNIWDGITGAFDGVINWIADSWKWLGDVIFGMFDWIGDFISSLTGGGGGGGYIGQVGKKLGLATGGYVRGMGTGDTVPAMLTPGELVVDRETGPQLREFLRGQDNNDIVLMEVLAAVRQPMVVQTTAQVDKKAFADIMLTINRQGLRTSGRVA
jgi:hypothetical protein